MSSVEDQIAALNAQIKALRTTQLDELRSKLADARKTVQVLEAEIALIAGEAASVKAPRRKRMSSEEVKGAILKALAATPTGMSQKQISDESGVNYQTVVKFFKDHPKDFKSTGKLRSKKFFLK